MARGDHPSAPRTLRRWTGARIVAAALLGVASTAHNGCSETLSIQDEAGTIVDASPTEASLDSSLDDTGADADDAGCTSTFAVSSSCTHPAVERKCTGGFCEIPPGCFVMGSPECQPKRGLRSEPEAQVTLTHRFEIAEHEVTQEEWSAVGFTNNARPPDLDAGRDYGSCLEPTCPATLLTWFDALSYANKASTAHIPPLPECYTLQGCTGTPGNGLKCEAVRATPDNVYTCRGYRLPTEAEWEYAVRAGTRTPYYTGPMTRASFDLSKPCHTEGEPFLDRAAWYCATAASLSPLFYSTHPVMKKQPNAWGLYDMLGNVQEWTSDVYTGLGYQNGPYIDLGSDLGDGGERTLRGGSSTARAGSTTASYRLGMSWNFVSAAGFRLARTLD